MDSNSTAGQMELKYHVYSINLLKTLHILMRKFYFEQVVHYILVHWLLLMQKESKASSFVL